MPDRIRVGVLGLGAVAQAVHLPLLDRLADRFEIAAIADLSASLVETIGERHRVPAASRLTTLDALLAIQGLDGLLILTSGSHGESILAGLDRGVAVFAEKPLAWTLSEADAITARLAADPRRKLQVGYMKLYDPAVVEGLAVAGNTGRIGSIRSIEVCVLHPTGERQLAHARLLPPATDIPAETIARLREEEDRLCSIALGPAAAELGQLYSNVVLGSIVHELALIRAFAGDPTEIDTVDVWPEERWPPSVAITGRLGGDARFAIRWHFLPDCPAYREEVRVVSERATIELEFPSPYLLHAPTDLRIAELSDRGRRDTRHRSVVEAFEEELLAFHALVVDGLPPKAGSVEGRADIVTSQRIVARRAAQSGLPIETEAPA
ncbi:MAG: Gfo/Idh/MocA family oxidoreductase [Candidatus Limnocylindrales bacterium]|nr:Gfo/Idh/MocA family oxidoreductase [Candidatus Limnocylindrales bacterium]